MESFRTHYTKGCEKWLVQYGALEILSCEWPSWLKMVVWPHKPISTMFDSKSKPC